MKRPSTRTFYVFSILTFAVTACLFTLGIIFIVYNARTSNIKSEQMDLKKQYVDDILDFSNMIIEDGYDEWQFNIDKTKTPEERRQVDRLYKDRVKVLLSLFRFDNNDGFFVAYELRGIDTYYAFYATDFKKWNREAMAFDRHGEVFLKKLIENAKAGKGFVDYLDTKPSKGILKQKYVNGRYFKPWNWVIITGFFAEDVEAKVNELTKAVIIERNMFFVMSGIIFAVISVIALGIGFFFIKKDPVPDIRSTENPQA